MEQTWIIPIFITIASSIFFRMVLSMLNQRWALTFAYTSTIFLLPIGSFFITKVISGNIALSLGMVGALSIVRFRNPVKSPLELSIYFILITIGITASVDWRIAGLLTAFVLLILILLHITDKTSLKLRGKSLYSISFTEGNLIHTLNIDSKNQIEYLANSHLLAATTKMQDGKYQYVLLSESLIEIETIRALVDKDPFVISYSYRKN